ncbi:histone-lysine N-methyltransferase EHMT2-like protein [Dinothrombium tinctorium]|uniref:Histone-lysine N-methyltransferase EHMT2-like protein n=1 Tax=Dinothrombium tinctorium TaxID=1965070 RepID=A0A3S3R0D3_9ACAR|nr:histone-lysine N-methyltransferase EHMT2-like protein [Dinothrombium tinctorium]
MSLVLPSEDEKRGVPSSVDANVSAVSGEFGSTSQQSTADSLSTSKSVCDMLQDTLRNMPNKGSARKGFARSVAPSSAQHEAQAKFKPDRPASSSSAVASTAAGAVTGIVVAPSAAELAASAVVTGARSHNRARKSFANDQHSSGAKAVDNAAPGNITVSASSLPSSSHDEKNENHSSAPSSLSGVLSGKKRKRYYKGATYNLFLSKKVKKRTAQQRVKTKNDNGSNAGTDTLGEESNQSFTAGTGSEVESISSNDENNEDSCDKPADQEVVENGEQVNGDVSADNADKKDVEMTDMAGVNNFAPDLGAENNEPIDEQNVQLLQSAAEQSESLTEERGENLECSGINVPQAITYPLPKRSAGSSQSVTKGGSSSAASVNQNESNSAKSNDQKILLRISSTGSVQSASSLISSSYNGGGDQAIKFFVMNDPKNTAPFGTCLCSEKPIANKNETTKGKPLFCQAIDSFDGKLIGCCNQARLTSLFRASKRVPYRVFCEVHLARLRRHHCCPGCGVFCSQGEFLECFCIKKQVHLFHKSCQIVQGIGPNKQHCPHCNNVSDLRCVRLEMNGAINNVYYLSQNPILKTPRAKITLCKLKELPALTGPMDDPGVEYIIPETKKILSLAGLPLGPSRKQLENLLTALSVEKQSPSIRFTNKNFYAVSKTGEVDKVLGLLAQGFDPNYTFEENDNETPLHTAAAAGHLVIVHLLIQAGASPNVLNKNMDTPLTLAVINKHPAVVKYLIKAGAAPDIRAEDGMTALHLASKNGSFESVFHIINAGKMNINLQDDGGWTPLVWATEHKHLGIVKLLISKGSDPNILDDEENSGLHWAAYSGDVNIAYIYIEMGVDVNAINIHGDTPLHVAARRDNYECVVLLLSRGADLTLLNKNNESPLMCCVKNSQSAMALKINCELRRFASIRKLNSDRLLHRDIAKGKEYYQIPIVNGVDNEPIPVDFMYVIENCETSPINIDRVITSLQSCKCEDDCTSDSCICAAISFRCWYDRDGKLVPEFNLMDPPMIFECNRACSCWKSCYNRVVQFGVRTQSKGWGVRPLKDIPKGTFVCEYIGEIITDSEADRREDDSYLFDLDNRDGETYCLDARFYGNVSRFINHACSPNLTPVKVFVDHQDLSYPRIALFANRDIKAFEELGFDYGEKFWVIKYRWFTCDCGFSECKYSKETIGLTLENYYKRIREEQTQDVSAMQDS